jgi:hypothetical protein
MCLLLQNDIHADDTITRVGTIQILIKNNKWRGPAVVNFPQQDGSEPQVIRQRGMPTKKTRIVS